jgi:hypothetical protein
MIKMKKIFILLILGMLVLPTIQVMAQDSDTYTLLAPLPGLTEISQDKALEKYVPYVFNLAIGIAAITAVVMIVFGGFQYMTSDAIGGKSEGKDRIKNAIFGLVLVIGAWLILYTINPNLLTLNLNIAPVSIQEVKQTLGGEVSAGTGNAVAGYTLSADQIAMNANMVTDLQNRGIGVNHSNPCANGATTGCTNLVGMTYRTYKGVIDLKNACTDCNITITGGTEGGHASHGPGKAPIDLRFDTKLDAYITNPQNQKNDVQTSSAGYPIYTVKVGDRNATFMKEDDHWHVVIQ